jgi:hypothetical protein
MSPSEANAAVVVLGAQRTLHAELAKDMRTLGFVLL